MFGSDDRPTRTIERGSEETPPTAEAERRANDDGVGRRSLLRATGSAVAASAALGTPGTTTVATAQGEGRIDRLAVQAGALRAHFRRGSVASLALIGPNGQQKATREPALGESSVGFPLGEDGVVDPEDGESVTVEAYDDADEQVGSASTTFEYEVSFRGFRAHDLDHPRVIVENSGTGRTRVQNVKFTEGIPNPENNDDVDIGIDPGEMAVVDFQPTGFQDRQNPFTRHTRDHQSPYEADCGGRTDTVTVEIGTPHGTFTDSVEATFGGETTVFSNEFACEEIAGGEEFDYGF